MDASNYITLEQLRANKVDFARDALMLHRLHRNYCGHACCMQASQTQATIPRRR